ncbi:hypothetical protein [Candidatus Nitrotoga sp. M5]|uniref:hypothetical protein n=1 Tax=Candidatus Nitrotoga sp. M5 TaxID=2890409 RepID=UPI001EF60550|nr:hypothetical protein [Candidatus Nitrotoga sp. M5]CAH1388050.1 conserved hypothetical protein [Candidatus Nitrotoga sp. M5]
MNGFLHRLAAQAIGNTNNLRSVACAPYATPLSLANSAEPDNQIPGLNSVVNERRNMGKNETARDSVPSQEQPHANFPTEISTQTRNNEVTPLLPEVFDVQLGSDSDSYAKPNPTNGPTSSVKAKLQQSSINKSVAGESPVVAEEIEIQEIEMHIPEDKITAFTDSNYPSPLLPLKNAARPSASNVNVAAQRAEQSGFGQRVQVEDVTEVHVSIGRIEVTAVHESQPQKRQAPTQAKPLSLDEYLARRGRGT